MPRRTDSSHPPIRSSHKAHEAQGRMDEFTPLAMENPTFGVALSPVGTLFLHLDFQRLHNALQRCPRLARAGPFAQLALRSQVGEIQRFALRHAVFRQWKPHQRRGSPPHQTAPKKGLQS